MSKNWRTTRASGRRRGEGEGAAVLAFLMLVLGVVLGHEIGDRHGRYLAIEAGAAHYEVDPKTGVVQFVWDCKK